MKYIPNILSVIRIALVGVFLALYLNASIMAALVVYVVAAITDFLDGYIARKYDYITDAGKLIDPLADKLMTIAAIYCLYDSQVLPDVYLYLIFGKELLMIMGGIFFYRRKKVVYARFIGKAATLLFNVGIGMAILHGIIQSAQMPLEWLSSLSKYILWIALGVAIIAFLNYGIALMKGAYGPKELEKTAS